MPVRTYNLGDATLLRFQDIVSDGPFPWPVAFPKQHNGEQTSAQLQHINFFGVIPIRRATMMRFDFGAAISTPGAVPVGSLITDAYLTVNSLGTYSDAMDVSVALLAEDGIWDRISTTEQFGAGSTFGHDGQMTVRDTAVVTIAPQTVATTSQNWNIRNHLLKGGVSGQTIQITTTGNLGSVLATLRRQTTLAPTATLQMEVYQAVANDGSDDTPDEGVGVIATSNTILHNALSTAAAGATATFSFPVGQQPSLTAGNRYVFVVRPNFAGGGGAFSPQMRTEIGDAYANGALQHGQATPIGFCESNYPEWGQIPFLYAFDDSTFYTAPSGSVVDLAMPTFPFNGASVTIPGLGPLIQEWIERPGYVTNKWVGVVIQSRGPVDGVNRFRQWDTPQLHVEYREARQVYVG
jgi:hypothetical protein